MWEWTPEFRQSGFIRHAPRATSNLEVIVNKRTAFGRRLACSVYPGHTKTVAHEGKTVLSALRSIKEACEHWPLKEEAEETEADLETSALEDPLANQPFSQIFSKSPGFFSDH